MSLYITTKDINDLQIKIIRFANEWAKREKTPIPKMELIEQMEKQNENKFTVLSSLEVLLRKGYLKRVKIYGSGYKTYYQILRSI